MVPACIICEKPVASRDENPSHPFCSERCRLVDLGRWLGGQYRIPGELEGVPEPNPNPEDEDGSGEILH